MGEVMEDDGFDSFGRNIAGALIVCVAIICFTVYHCIKMFHGGSQ